jgi:hypothetical protein
MMAIDVAFKIEEIEGYRLAWFGRRWLPWVPIIYFVPTAFGLSIEILLGGALVQIGPFLFGIVRVRPCSAPTH